MLQTIKLKLFYSKGFTYFLAVDISVTIKLLCEVCSYSPHMKLWDRRPKQGDFWSLCMNVYAFRSIIGYFLIGKNIASAH